MHRKHPALPSHAYLGLLSAKLPAQTMLTASCPISVWMSCGYLEQVCAWWLWVQVRAKDLDKTASGTWWRVPETGSSAPPRPSRPSLPPEAPHSGSQNTKVVSFPQEHARRQSLLLKATLAIFTQLGPCQLMCLLHLCDHHLPGLSLNPWLAHGVLRDPIIPRDTCTCSLCLELASSHFYPLRPPIQHPLSHSFL